VCSGIRGKGVFAREGQQGLGKEGGREGGIDGRTGQEKERESMCSCLRVALLHAMHERMYLRSC